MSDAYMGCDQEYKFSIDVHEVDSGSETDWDCQQTQHIETPTFLISVYMPLYRRHVVTVDK